MPDIFHPDTTLELVERLNNLTPESQPLWGSMNVAQMLAHCNVTYEMVYTDKHPKPKVLMKFILKNFVKKSVVGDKPYPKNGRTAPAFKIVDEREFDKEKQQLINHIIQTQELGASHFDGKESHSFGALSIKEWNNLFYKHLDHHLTQFGV
jgi:hypothetical protein